MQGYWISEKLNGLRAEWTGREFLSRNRNVFHAPDWFKSEMPRTPLSGELYIGPNTLDECQSIVRSRFADWHKVSFNVFDMPREFGVFSDRVAAMAALILPAHCAVIPQRICAGEPDALEMFNAVVARDGEGVIMRSPWSELEQPRHIIKLKRSVHEIRNGRYACEMLA